MPGLQQPRGSVEQSMRMEHEIDQSGAPARQISEQRIKCPACGYENPADVVFCQEPQCHKALGEFRYVNEELLREARWYETAAARAIRFVGSPHFLSAHLFWFVTWLTINLGIVPLFRRFDPYPFELLGIVLAIETIFITGFVLISSNRLSQYSEKRAELDYEASVRTYRDIKEVRVMVQDLVASLQGQRE